MTIHQQGTQTSSAPDDGSAGCGGRVPITDAMVNRFKAQAFATTFSGLGDMERIRQALDVAINDGETEQATRPRRTLCPPTWTGYQPKPDGPFVCGACPDWQLCDVMGHCERATGGLYTWAREAARRWDKLVREFIDVRNPTESERRLMDAMHQLRELSR